MYIPYFNKSSWKWVSIPSPKWPQKFEFTCHNLSSAFGRAFDHKVVPAFVFFGKKKINFPDILNRREAWLQINGALNQNREVRWHIVVGSIRF